MMIFVVLAVVLIGAAVVLNRGSSGPTPGAGSGPAATPSTRTTPEAPAQAWFSAATVRALAVRREGSVEERVERQSGGGWSYRAGRVEWPANVPDSALASLAALAEVLRVSPTTIEPAAQPGDATITIIHDDGPDVSLRVSAAALGGRSPVLAMSGSRRGAYLVESAVVAALIEPGPRAWRTTAALPDAAGSSRLTLTDNASTLVLARLEGRWDVRRPVAARASQRAVATLLGALGDLQVLRFEDPARVDPSAYGLHRPRLVVTSERDERVVQTTGQVIVQVRTRELYVGGPADAKGDTLFASPDPDGSLIMVVPASGISALGTSPRNYLAPTATAIEPASVFMFTIHDSEAGAGAVGAERGFRREGERWITLISSGGAGARLPADSAEVSELLEFLSKRSGVPDPAEGADELRVLRSVKLFDDQGDAMEILSIGYTADGALAARAGNLVVNYGSTPGPALLELPAFASLPAAPEKPAPVQAGPGAPVSK